MAYPEPQGTEREREIVQVNPTPRKPRVLLAASGSVASIKFENLCHCVSEWAEVKAVATKASLHFIDKASLPKDLKLYTMRRNGLVGGKLVTVCFPYGLILWSLPHCQQTRLARFLGDYATIC